MNVPIRDGFNTVYAKNSIEGLLPNENNEYALSFASFFKQEVKLPDNAVVLEDISDTCITEVKDHESAYYNYIEFKFED